MLEFLKKLQSQPKRPFQLSELIEILQDGVCISNKSGNIIYANKAAYFLLNIEQNTDILNLNFFNHFINDKNKIDFFVHQLDQEGMVRNYELQLTTQQETLIDVILTINIIGDFRQDTFGYLFLFKDITELKKIQQQLLQSQKLESVGLMASGIAHDFNNILAAIIPNSELIKISTKPGQPNHKRAEIIEKSAHRASEIAQRLLTFTRQGNHGNFDLIDLNKVIEESLDIIGYSIHKNIEIQKKLNLNISPIKGDAAQVQQIVMNLVINSVDAMPEGGKITISTEDFQIKHYYQIGALDPGKYIRLTVEDNGLGIPLNILSKIFDPFFTTKDIGKGTGLGLSVVYGIVRAMKGHIEVSSKVKESTRFDIYFPVYYDIEEDIEVRNNDTSSASRAKFMIIDDEDYVLNILGDTLEYLGFEIEKFNNGMDATQHLKNNKNEIQYAIIDLKMPRMDGRMTSRKLREINPNLQIIFTSGFDDHPVTNDDLGGIIGFIKKPYSIKQVSKALDEILMRQ